MKDECLPILFKFLLPNASLVCLPECGHAPMMEKPDKFNKALDQFLNK